MLSSRFLRCPFLVSGASPGLDTIWHSVTCPLSLLHLPQIQSSLVLHAWTLRLYFLMGFVVIFSRMDLRSFVGIHPAALSSPPTTLGTSSGQVFCRRSSLGLLCSQNEAWGFKEDLGSGAGLLTSWWAVGGVTWAHCLHQWVKTASAVSPFSWIVECVTQPSPGKASSLL